MSVTGNQYPVPANELYTSLYLGLKQLADFPHRIHQQTLTCSKVQCYPRLVRPCCSAHLNQTGKVQASQTQNSPPSWPPSEPELQNLLKSSIKLILQDQWDAFSSSMKDHIPSKLTSSTYTKPWANTMIKRLSRRQKKALKKYRLTKHPKDLARLKKLQKVQRSECVPPLPVGHR